MDVLNMDIVYVLGGDSKNDNLELRMSLRSIEKYGKNIGKVVVVGKPTAWLSKEVIKVVVKDEYSFKHQNILRCIEKVVDLCLVEGDFLYSSDDHFYVKNVDFDAYPYFYKCELRGSVNKTDPYYQYHKSLVDTRMLCKKHQFPFMNYSQHCNTHMHTAIIKQCRDIIHESYKFPFGAEPTSLIMNAWQKTLNPPQTTKREDLKILEALTKEEIYRQIGDRDCFSIGDSIFKYKAIYDFFEKEYPEKSRFED